MSRWAQRLGLFAVILVMAACATKTPAPVVERGPPATARPTAPPVAAAPAPVPAKPAAEPDWRPKTYTVKRGDTLQAIALDYGLDYRDLAAWNAIENPNLIRVGQVLRLAPPSDGGAVASASTREAASGVTTAPLRPAAPIVAADPKAAAATPAAGAAPGSPAVVRNTDNYKTQPKILKEPYSEQALRDVQKAAAAQATGEPPGVVASAATSSTAGATAGGAHAPVAAPVVPAPGPGAPGATSGGATGAAGPTPAARAPPSAAAGGSDDDDRIDWMWPTVGKLITGFSDTANLKGVDIAGKAGQPVVASAAGKVVYAGTGLRGYGKLVIVKHNNTFLTAYAHNSELLVKEGQQVARGQKIAEMGSSDSEQVKLHFEIRRLGKPVDPLKYLPAPA